MEVTLKSLCLCARFLVSSLIYPDFMSDIYLCNIQNKVKVELGRYLLTFIKLPFKSKINKYFYNYTFEMENIVNI